ncbi:MAG: hypothetical protein ABL977_01630 [Candidatus Eisenbacteria bacterium]
MLALLALSLAASARAESPVLVVSAGSSLSPDGKPGTGGAAGAVGLMFPLEGRWSFGAALFAEDLGTGLTELHDPNTGEALGTVAELHRWTYGGEWRAEARLHNARRARLSWGAAFGYGRQERDVRGSVDGAVSGVTAGTSLTFLVPAPHGHAFGASVAARRLFVHADADPDRSTSWATAALEWRWQGTPKE